MPKADLQFKVIANEFCCNGYNPHYYCAEKFKDEKWSTDGHYYDSMEKLAENMARKIVGTKAFYEVDSMFLEGVPNFEEKGIRGYSESKDTEITRILDREELRMLAINLGVAIKKRRRDLTINGGDY